MDHQCLQLGIFYYQLNWIAGGPHAVGGLSHNPSINMYMPVSLFSHHYGTMSSVLIISVIILSTTQKKLPPPPPPPSPGSPTGERVKKTAVN